MSFLVIDRVVNVTFAGGIRVAYHNAEGAPKVRLGGLHCVLVQDPPVGLTLLCGLRDWETGGVCYEYGMTAKHYKPKEWATLSEVGFAGGQDEGLWGGRVG